jgi:hypothetical protein
MAGLYTEGMGISCLSEAKCGLKSALHGPNPMARRSTSTKDADCTGQPPPRDLSRTRNQIDPTHPSDKGTLNQVSPVRVPTRRNEGKAMTPQQRKKGVPMSPVKVWQ